MAIYHENRYRSYLYMEDNERVMECYKLMTNMNDVTL